MTEPHPLVVKSEFSPAFETAASLTPRETVNELDKYIVGQEDAKRAVALTDNAEARALALEAARKSVVLLKNDGVWIATAAGDRGTDADCGKPCRRCSPPGPGSGAAQQSRRAVLLLRAAGEEGVAGRGEHLHDDHGTGAAPVAVSLSRHAAGRTADAELAGLRRDPVVVAGEVKYRIGHLLPLLVALAARAELEPATLLSRL